jgi:hypothetical protein
MYTRNFMEVSFAMGKCGNCWCDIQNENGYIVYGKNVTNMVLPLKTTCGAYVENHICQLT